MVDCGLAQGKDSCVPIESWPVKPSQVDYLFLTHAHIDHIGRVLELIRNGFDGEIITTHATKALLVPMLEDGLSFTHLTPSEADRIVETIDKSSWGFEYGQTFELKNSIGFQLGNSGHILGSCFVRMEIRAKSAAPPAPPPRSIIFSGDLGAKDTPLLPDPEPPGPCDLLLLESTYGDRLHEERSRRTRRLGEVLTKALSDGGKVFIPAFALGRAQELIYEIDRLLSDPELQRTFPALQSRKLPVCIDSPLGLKLTRIYSLLKPYWDTEAKQLLLRGDHPLDFDRLYAVSAHKDHLSLLHMPGPAIIIAGSGMCTGGRIVNHLKTGLQDPRNDVVFVGYQAEDTPGRAIIEHATRPGGYVILEGERIPLRAKVHNLSGYSAHADQAGLLAWVRSMPEKPGRIRLVHGEPSAQAALAAHLRREGYAVSGGRSLLSS